MTRLNIFALLLSSTFFSISSFSAELNLSCQVPNIPQLKIDMATCDKPSGLSRFTFIDSQPTSPYATDFDRRHVVVISSMNANLVRSTSGFRNTGNALSIAKTQLVSPPNEDQIASRNILEKVIKKSDWLIVTERVQYGVQGGLPGFVIDCSTAFRKRKTNSFAVAECYPLEQRQRFYELLASGM